MPVNWREITDVSAWDDENLDMAMVGLIGDLNEYDRATLIAVLKYVWGDLAAYAVADSLAHPDQDDQVTAGRWFSHDPEESYLADWEDAAWLMLNSKPTVLPIAGLGDR